MKSVVEIDSLNGGNARGDGERLSEFKRRSVSAGAGGRTRRNSEVGTLGRSRTMPFSVDDARVVRHLRLFDEALVSELLMGQKSLAGCSIDELKLVVGQAVTLELPKGMEDQDWDEVLAFYRIFEEAVRYIIGKLDQCEAWLLMVVQGVEQLVLARDEGLCDLGQLLSIKLHKALSDSEWGREHHAFNAIEGILRDRCRVWDSETEVFEHVYSCKYEAIFYYYIKNVLREDRAKSGDLVNREDRKDLL